MIKKKKTLSVLLAFIFTFSLFFQYFNIVKAEETKTPIKIGEAKKQSIGTVVTVEGIVTLVDGSNNFIQDDTAGICVYKSGLNLKVGNKIRVTGTLKDYNGLIELVDNKDNNFKTTLLEENTQIPEVTNIEISTVNLKDYQSMRVMLKNVELGETTTSGSVSLTKLKDKNGQTIDIKNMPTLDGINVGDKVNVVGILGWYKNPQLIVKDANDIQKVVQDEDNETPIVDVVKPNLTILYPQSGQTIQSTNPEIVFEAEDESKIQFINLYVDENDVTNFIQKENISTNKIKIIYTPENSFNNGEHKVKAIVVDAANNTSILEWNFYIGELQYNLYFGQIHSHTNYSDGLGTPEEAFTYARDNAKADFFAITDHSNSFDNDTLATLNDGSKSQEWTSLHEIADRFNKDDKFVAIGAYEMTWSGSTGGWGHINTFNTPGFLSRNSKINNKAVDLKTYYDELKKQSQSISQFNHPGPQFGDFADFGYYDAEIDKVINLIEVGNGEGPIRSNGYFPSYEYYTRALDKGWHLAPTNNQDNHKGNWILANTARTVVIAPRLTRNEIYEAFRNRRVYATEDNNLRIDYKVNGHLMGEILNDAKELDFKINITDPDNEPVGTVSIIANGGTVVAKQKFNDSTANWHFKLNPDYSYYYVRVDQEDKDIAVTAPVWAGEVVPYGISKIEADKKVQVSGKNIIINTILYNNSTNPLNGVKVEFYKNSITDENKITEQTVNIEPSSTTNCSINYISESLGEATIYAKATVENNGTVKSFILSTKVEFVDKDEAVVILIDGGHYNQYVSGNYKGKINGFKSMLNNRKYIVIENNDEITKEDLDGVSLLVLTDPESTDNATYGLKKSCYTNNEIEVIKEYINTGGNLIITSKADYKDAAELKYQNSTQGNLILEAINSNLRFNDDEIVDNAKNVNGLPYKLLFNRFVSNKYNLTKSLTEENEFSVYSGCSVILKENADDTNVDFVVKGHDTTEILDSDKQNDAKNIEKGNVYVLAAEKLSNGSKVIVAGSTFFSDFEITGDNVYANVAITQNILDWMLTKDNVVTKISEVRKDEDKNNVPDNLGKKYTVEGYVTAESVAMGNGHSFFDVIYVQDETGGITVFGVSNRKIPLGSKVRVTGKVDQYLGDTELQIRDENIDVEILDDKLVDINPFKLSTKQSMLEENEGWLVEVRGKVTKIEGQNIYVDDGSGVARVYLEGYVAGNDISNSGKWDSNIKVGNTIIAIGLASEDSEGKRIRVRNADEIINLGEEIIKLEKISETVAAKGQDYKLSIKATNKFTESKEVTLIIGLYDKDNKFLQYIGIQKDIKPQEEIILNGFMKIPNLEGLKIKYFVWDNIDNMNVLSEINNIDVK